MSFPDYQALLELGWTPFFQQQLFSLESPSTPERVVAERRGEYLLLGVRGERRAVLAGRVRHRLPEHAWPCVGDFVLCDADQGDTGRIEHVFERATLLKRKAPGPSSEAQPIAANVDLVIVVAALAAEEADQRVQERGVNPRRIERYLAAVAESGARAVVAVNKADLSAQGGETASELSEELGRADVLLVSAHSGLGISALLGRLAPRESAVLVGSSGVGKSSLTNVLLGREAQRVHDVREDDTRGRHTTTARQLFRLPNGGYLIDTPGMRELGLWSDSENDGVATAFDDIEVLGERCRFRDCRHEQEPGCAVREAALRGELSPERLEHAHKLRRELEWQRERTDALYRQQEIKKRKVLARNVRAVLAKKGRAE